MAANRVDYSLTDLIDLMAQHKLRRLKLNQIEIDMDPEGFTRAVEPVEDGTVAELQGDSSKVCACGHGIMTEHNEHGCLHGCSVDICAPLGRPEAEG